jgi:hypothetical protein
LGKTKIKETLESGKKRKYQFGAGNSRISRAPFLVDYDEEIDLIEPVGNIRWMRWH